MEAMRKLAFSFAVYNGRWTGAGQTPDETVHLAAGLQFARFWSVVGTLWATAAQPSEDGPEMVARLG
jgi:hypothetical protein